MEVQMLLDQFHFDNIVSISPSQLEDIIKESKILEEKDTLISGQIRLLKFDKQILVQETTPKNEILLRKFESHKSAKKIIDDRLEIYDNMWDGCGCKIDYYK